MIFKLLCRWMALLVLVFFSASTQAQSNQAKQQEGLAWLESNSSTAVKRLIEIGGIISPSGAEHQRAQAVASIMRSIGLKDVKVDSMPNVIGVIPGKSDSVLVFVSTLDDLAGVAEHQKTLAKLPYHEGNKVIGPGTNTSSVTVAMLMAAEAIIQHKIQPNYTLVFAGVAQEETGLKGMKALFEQYRNTAIGFVDILGDGRAISYGGLAIHWWKVVVSGPPGHSLRGGKPNVNQGIGRAVDRIIELDFPEKYAHRNTVINIGKIESGLVFNHKPAEGWFSLDIRSLDGEIVAEIEKEVYAILEKTGQETGTSLKMEEFQITPGGQIPWALDSDLVQKAILVSRSLGLEPALSNSGSANLNVPLSNGKLAIGLGGERGGQRGFPDEWADVDSMMRAAKHVFLLALQMDKN